MLPNEKLSASDVVGSGMIMRPTLSECMDIIGTFHIQHVRDGEVLFEEDFNNLVTTQGKNAMLDKFLDLGTAYAAIRLGLHTTVGNAASTYASPSPQVESTVSSRVTPSFSAASAGSKATSAAASFSITGTATITGAFCAIGAAGISSAGDTAATAVLLSTGSFSSSRSVLNLDTINVTWSLAL
jgi:hypothetical protein